MTRTANSYDAWGPCVWDRAKQANRIGADAMVSIHADGAPSSGRGFFVLAPGLVKGWTEDVVKPGRRLADAMIDGMAAAGAPRSNYISEQLMISRDTTSLNFSNVPTVTVELGQHAQCAGGPPHGHVRGSAAVRRVAVRGYRGVLLPLIALRPSRGDTLEVKGSPRGGA